MMPRTGVGQPSGSSACGAARGGVVSRPMRTAYRTCPFCEATCGLEVTLDGDDVVRVRGDADDVFSRGFLCPKGVGLQALHDDPDRLRTPLVRSTSGTLE